MTYRRAYSRLVSGSPNRGQRTGVTPILSDLRRFCPTFAGVLQTLENKAPILFNFAPILSDLAFLQIRQNETRSARPLRAVPFWEFPIVLHSQVGLELTDNHPKLARCKHLLEVDAYYKSSNSSGGGPSLWSLGNTRSQCKISCSSFFVLVRLSHSANLRLFLHA